MSHPDRVVRREPDTHGLPATVEAAHVAGVDVDEQIGLGDEPVHDDRIAVLRRSPQIGQAVRVLRVVAAEALAELADELGADDSRELGRAQLSMKRVGADQRDLRAADTGRGQLAQDRLDRDRANRPVGRHRRVVERDRDPRMRLHEIPDARKPEGMCEGLANGRRQVVDRRRRQRLGVREGAGASGERRGQRRLTVRQLDVHDLDISASAPRLTDCRRYGGTRPRRARPS